MTRFPSEQSEKNALLRVAEMMAASARTAPKARGVDAIKTLIVDGDDLEELAVAMEQKAEQKYPQASANFKRDANNLRNSGCVLLIGVTGSPKKIEQPLDCGACGYQSCAQFLKVKKRTVDYTGPNCVFQAIDLGIALCSAAKLASDFGIDNRMMYTIGTAAKQLGFLNSDVIVGIPLSVTGKSPFFDRK
ncbi:ferredoxin domain-containing protein [Chloroflexota bacterium]